MCIAQGVSLSPDTQCWIGTTLQASNAELQEAMKSYLRATVSLAESTGPSRWDALCPEIVCSLQLEDKSVDFGSAQEFE